MFGRNGSQTRQPERQLIPALRSGQRVHLIHDDTAKPVKEVWPVRLAQQDGQALGCGQQDVRRIDALTGLLRRRGVACAVLDPHLQTHLGDGRAQVPGNVRGQRLQGRDIERVQALMPALGQFDQRGQKPGQGLPRACGCDQEGVQSARIQQRPLVRMQGPAAGGEPSGEGFRQRHGARIRRPPDEGEDRRGQGRAGLRFRPPGPPPVPAPRR